MNPFIVTTKRPNCSQGTRCTHAAVSRRAVATLEEAKRLVHQTACIQHHDGCSANHITESGGSVGPLPDGTVIEVEVVSQQRMRSDLRTWTSGLDTRDALDDTISGAWVDAFNAREAGR